MSTEMYVKTFSIHYTNENSTWKPYLDVCTSTEKVPITYLTDGFD